jgi:hypothetical protein
MIVNKLETMEKIISKNKNLCWIGWDVADRRRTEAGRTAINGVRVNGQWYVQTIYKLTNSGWGIPNKYRI